MGPRRLFRPHFIHAVREDGDLYKRTINRAYPEPRTTLSLKSTRIIPPMAGAECVVHTAGPFQGRTNPALLRAALLAGLTYVDVCDEASRSSLFRVLQEIRHASISSLVIVGLFASTIGCWP